MKHKCPFCAAPINQQVIELEERVKYLAHELAKSKALQSGIDLDGYLVMQTPTGIKNE